MIGHNISNYKITEELGKGGMGTVYKAEDTKLKRTVALKFLSSQHLGTTEDKARFIREAQTAAALDHPNICTIYEINEVNNQLFISMAYIDGMTLSDKIQSGRLKLDEALDAAIAVAQGLDAAHHKGIVHRDIKSANIMVTRKGQATITDFGLAKLHDATKVTKTGMTLGTLAYMSPEQARGDSVDYRTDLWSLGVVIYEMLTGQMPFKGDYEQAVLYNIVNQDPEPVTSLRAEIPKELEKIINRCMQKNPSNRYQHAHELVAALEEAKKSLPASLAGSKIESAPVPDNTGNAHSEPRVTGTTETLPGYKIVRKLSEGGQGIVYQAVQESTKRKVAIKMMREGAFASRSAQGRFEREVRILARLNHPNIVAIHDSGATAGGQYFIMDYIAGLPLDEYMQSPDAPRSIRDIMQLFERICNAVKAAHLAGIIHRDLKPSNIRIDYEGKPYILDFGLAKAALDDSNVSMMTMTGQFMGSLQWASPEQAMGMPDKIDMRTDVYSLGVILYHMLTGEFPYPVSGSMHEVLNRIVKTEPQKVSTLRREANDEVNTIVLKCLSKDRERRYQTAGELARDVQNYLGGEPIEAKRDSIGYMLKKQLVRHKAPVGVGAGFVVVIMISLIISLILWRRAVSERENAHFHMETARAEVIKSFEEYQAIIPRLRRAEDIAALLPKEVHRDYPEDSPKASYLEATKWISDLFPSTPDSIPTTGYATLNSQTRDAIRSSARHAYRGRDPIAVAWVQANKEGISRLAASTREHRFNLGGSSGGDLLLHNLLPSLADVRFGVEALTVGALLRHDDEDPEGAIDNLEAAVRMSRYAGDGATLINMLVEIYCINVIHNAYRWMVVDAEMKGQLASAYTLFMRQTPPLPDYGLAYITEVRALRQVLNEAYTKVSARYAAKLDLARLKDLAEEWGMDENPYSDQSPAMIAHAEALEYETAISIVTKMCDRLRKQQDASFREIRAEGERVHQEIQANHPALVPLIPNFTHALVLRRKAQMNRDATIIAAAICFFRQAKGVWPETIDEALAAIELEPKGRDYYGHDFVYRIINDKPLLYAVGPNGVDDDGQGHRYESKTETNEAGDDVLFIVPGNE